MRSNSDGSVRFSFRPSFCGCSIKVARAVLTLPVR
jgi:hypothetical protein